MPDSTELTFHGRQNYLHVHVFSYYVSGLGFGFLFLSSFQSVGQCFHGQKTLVATSVGTASIGVGSVVYPYLIKFLEANYGLKGMLLILGGITLNSIPLTCTWDNSVPNAISSTFPEKPVKCGILFGICRHLRNVLKYSPFPFVLFGIGLPLSVTVVFEILTLDILKSAGLSSDNSMTCYIILQAVSVPGRLVPGFMNKIPGFSSVMSPVLGSLLGGVVMILLNYIRSFEGNIHAGIYIVYENMLQWNIILNMHCFRNILLMNHLIRLQI